MKFSAKEFEAMQMGWRRWYIEKVELKTFQNFGLLLRGADILEVGCGNGYAASLITAAGAKSYTGLDIMPEQLKIARGRELPGASFVRRLYVPKGFFTLPFGTKASLEQRLKALYREVSVHKVKAEWIFCCVK